MLKKITLSIVGSLFLIPAFAASDYPTKPIRIIIPYSAGGGTDSLMRVLSVEMQKNLGQPVVIENKPGASTMIGARFVSQAEPDGYTLLVSTHGTFALTPYSLPSAGFNPDKDIKYIATLGETSTVLFTGTNSSIKSFEDFIKKAKETELSYANNGFGNTTHMAAEFLRDDLKIKMLSIPFKGVEGSVAVASGEVDVGLNGESAVVGLINGGKLRPLVVLQSERSPTLPDVPAIKEFGHNISASLLLNAAAPQGVPDEIIKKLETSFKKALENPEVKEKLLAGRTAPKFLDGEETKILMDTMKKDYEKVMIKNNIPYYKQ